jgi:hypothetical protein
MVLILRFNRMGFADLNHRTSNASCEWPGQISPIASILEHSRSDFSERLCVEMVPTTPPIKVLMIND